MNPSVRQVCGIWPKMRAIGRKLPFQRAPVGPSEQQEGKVVEGAKPNSFKGAEEGARHRSEVESAVGERSVWGFDYRREVGWERLRMEEAPEQRFRLDFKDEAEAESRLWRWICGKSPAGFRGSFDRTRSSGLQPDSRELATFDSPRWIW
ncbi:hypothetical protein M5K25_027584 [Dendrobium thyrsiflorum]|uniref:Uncharacterized protein n=1 Tax=Dendrobium thyrsiflorum TaxID=117978 RepID=A0ABD0TUD3_DENTH